MNEKHQPDALAKLMALTAEAEADYLMAEKKVQKAIEHRDACLLKFRTLRKTHATLIEILNNSRIPHEQP